MRTFVFVRACVAAIGALSAIACERQSADDETPASLVQLEAALHEDSESVGFLWLDKEVTMLGIEEAVECSRHLPVSPKQALEAVRAYVEAHPEEGKLRARDPEDLTIEERDPRISIFRHYYFFRSKRNFKFSRPRLVGFFVDAHSGEAIPYPGPGFSGDEDDSPYRVNVPYSQVGEGKIMIDPEDPEAQYFMGRDYRAGISVPKSPEKAAAYFRQAADQGYVYAQTDYADCCWEGFGVPISREEAIRYYRMAAEQTARRETASTEAALKLAHFYALGEGVPQSWEQAVYWYGAAAYWDEPEAMFRLAECYEKGLGVPASRDKAVEHYRQITDDRRAESREDWKPWANRAAEALRRLNAG